VIVKKSFLIRKGRPDFLVLIAVALLVLLCASLLIGYELGTLLFSTLQSG
jgi:hypothetical protein